ncbi:MAG: alpha/beta hydrolase family protein [Candidatus Brocadiia bacterium]
MRVKIFLIPFLLLMCLVSFAADKPPKAPSQPESGPGGTEYAHKDVKRYRYGKGGQEYWIFEPADPAPDRAPVVVFNHGWTAMNPKIYGAWIDHIVRRGNVVIYPRYQANLATPPGKFTPNAIQAVKDAVRRLQKEKDHVRPVSGKFAVVGHSVGGLLSANIAALASESGLPRPKAVMCVQPGKSWGPRRIVVPLEDLSKISAATLLLTIAGDKDGVVRDVDAKRIYRRANRIPARNKDFVLMRSDGHGRPPLEANHLAPVAADERYDSGDGLLGGGGGVRRGKLRDRIRERRKKNKEGERSPIIDRAAGGDSVDALDYYGTWRLFDALCRAAFEGKNRESALGDTAGQRFMGRWSDGEAVKELVVSDPD